TMPKNKQGKALGLLGAMHGLSAVIGPNLGAVILKLTGTWQWMFLINIPIALFLIIFGYLKIPETKAQQSKRLYLKGTALLKIGILPLVFWHINIDNSNISES